MNRPRRGGHTRYPKRFVFQMTEKMHRWLHTRCDNKSEFIRDAIYDKIFAEEKEDRAKRLATQIHTHTQVANK